MKYNILPLLFVPFFIAGGCKKNDTSNEVFSQVNPAKDNGKILTSYLLGNTGGAYCLSKAVPSGNGEIFYAASNANTSGLVLEVVVGSNNAGTANNNILSEYYEVGKLSTSGAKLWTQYLDFQVRGIHSTTWQSGLLKNGLLVYGQNKLGKTILTAFNNSGTKISSLELNAPNCRLNSAVRIPSSDRIIAFGGCKLNGIDYPFEAIINVSNNGVLTSISETVILSMPNKWFVTGQYTNTFGSKFIATVNSDDKKSTIVAISQSYQVVWGYNIGHNGASGSVFVGEHLLVDNNKVYLVSSVNDITKPLQNANYWSSGLATCFTLTGDIIWSNPMSFSNRGDNFFDLKINGNFIFIAGRHSCFSAPNTEQSFSNGLLVKIDKNFGSLYSSYTFGKGDFSAFYSLVFNGNKLSLLGISEGSVSKSSQVYKGWIISLDLNSL